MKDIFEEVNKVDEMLMDMENMITALLEQAPEKDQWQKQHGMTMWFKSQLRIMRHVLLDSRAALDDVGQAVHAWGSRTA